MENNQEHNHDLENKKLQAEINEIQSRIAMEQNRFEVEQKKVGSEILDIEFKKKLEQKRFDAEQTKAKREGLRNWLKIGATIGTLVLTIFTVGMQAYDYLDKQERLYDHEVSETMLNLITQLNKKKVSDDDHEQEYATILLSAFEKDAIPILLTNLKNEKDPRPTIQSLALIMKKEKVKSSDVLNPLIDFSKQVFHSESFFTNSTMYPMKNVIKALGALGRDQKEEVLTLLDSFKNPIEENSSNPDKESINHLVLNAVNDAKLKINQEWTMQNKT